MLKAAEDAGAELVIVDGAAVARDVAHMAAEVADFVLIPTKGAVFDTMSMTQTIDVVRQVSKHFRSFLISCHPRAKKPRTR